MTKYKSIVIGTRPAGLTAAIYLALESEAHSLSKAGTG
jgi:thioredoxin reductase